MWERIPRREVPEKHPGKSVNRGHLLTLKRFPDAASYINIIYHLLLWLSSAQSSCIYLQPNARSICDLSAPVHFLLLSSTELQCVLCGHEECRSEPVNIRSGSSSSGFNGCLLGRQKNSFLSHWFYLETREREMRTRA